MLIRLSHRYVSPHFALSELARADPRSLARQEEQIARQHGRHVIGDRGQESRNGDSQIDETLFDSAGCRHMDIRIMPAPGPRKRKSRLFTGFSLAILRIRG